MCDARLFYLSSIYKLSQRVFKYARYSSKNSCFLAIMYIKFSLPFVHTTNYNACTDDMFA